MRPYAEEIVTSLHHTLERDLIPHLDDGWSRYVAKSMLHMLNHLERRLEHEGRLLVEDSDDMRRMFEAVSHLREAGSATVAEVVGRGLALGPGDLRPWTSVPELTVVNEALRAVLVELIEALDALAPGDIAPQNIRDAREEIRQTVTRQVERDTFLAEHTFVSFDPASTTS